MAKQFFQNCSKAQLRYTVRIHENLATLQRAFLRGIFSRFGAWNDSQTLAGSRGKSMKFLFGLLLVVVGITLLIGLKNSTIDDAIRAVSK
jgi:hypothetical protein